MRPFVFLLLLSACGAAPPAPTQAPQEPMAQANPPAEATPAENPPSVSSPAQSPSTPVAPASADHGWTHDEARWGIALRAAQDLEHADVHGEYGLGFAPSNHASVLLCPNVAIGMRVEDSDTEHAWVSTYRITDLTETIEGMEFIDAENPSSFLCHPEWPACVQGRRLYVFADAKLASIDQQWDYDFPSLEAEQRPWILQEIERQTHLDSDSCSNALANLRRAP